MAELTKFKLPKVRTVNMYTAIMYKKLFYYLLVKTLSVIYIDGETINDHFPKQLDYFSKSVLAHGT